MTSLLAAVLTPFLASGQIDLPQYYEHCHYLLTEQRIDKVVLFGTTGEGLQCTVEERKNAHHYLIDKGIAGDQLIINISAKTYDETLSLTKNALKNHTYEVLSMPPASDDEKIIINYYQKLIKEANNPQLKIYLYHYPEQGASISPETIYKLKKEFPHHIVGIKNSGQYADTKRFLALREKIMSEQGDAFFDVYVGNEVDMPEALRNGGKGGISGLANVAADFLFVYVKNPEINRDKLAAFISDLKQISPTIIPALKTIKAYQTGNVSWKITKNPHLTPPLSKDEEIILINKFEQLIKEEQLRHQRLVH